MVFAARRRGDMVNVYKRWKIGNIGYIVGRQGLKWQQIGNTIGNNRQHPNSEARPAIGVKWAKLPTLKSKIQKLTTDGHRQIKQGGKGFSNQANKEDEGAYVALETGYIGYMADIQRFNQRERPVVTIEADF